MGSNMDRREFLKSQLTGSLCVASGLMLPGKLLAGTAPPDVAAAKGGPAAATRAAVELLGGMGRFVKKGNRVLIKPNMSFPVPPERASNTHPEVVREIAVMCKEAGASRVLILDNPLAPPDQCLEASGIAEACKPIDAGMVHMVTDESRYKASEIAGGVRLTRTDIMKDALDSDVLIAAPVAKSHSGAGVSLSMKGMMALFTTG